MIHHTESFPPVGVACVNLFSLHLVIEVNSLSLFYVATSCLSPLGGTHLKVPFEGRGRLGAFPRKELVRYCGTHLLLLLGSHSYLVPSVYRQVFRYCVSLLSLLSSNGISTERVIITLVWADGHMTIKLNRLPWRVLLFDPRLVW